MQEWQNVDTSVIWVMVPKSEFDELKEALKELLAAMGDNDDNDSYSRFTKAEEHAVALVAKYAEHS